MKSIITKSIITLFAFLLVATWTYGQEVRTVDNIRATNTKAIFLGKSSPKLNLPGEATRKRKKVGGAKKDIENPNFKGRGKSNVVRPELEHQGPDPIRQTTITNRSRTLRAPSVNMDGLSSGSPSDPSGAAGVSFYLQGVNTTEIGVYTKSGILQSTFSGNSLWQPLGEVSAGDPIILHDSETNQWIITEFAPTGRDRLLVGVSETSDPRGDYFVYSFATPNFPDYPKYSIWSDAITVTTNEEGPGQLHQYFIDRDALMSGAEDVTVQRVEIMGNNDTEAGFLVASPVNWLDGPTPLDSRPITLRLNDSSWGDVPEDALEVFLFDVDFNTPGNTTVENISLVTTPYDGFPCSVTTGGGDFPCVPQRDGGGLDAIPEIIMNSPQYRNFETHESIVLNFITDVTDGENLSGIRWMELRRSDGNDWSIFQEGTFAPDDGLDRFMGSIAIDGAGNIGLGYNVSSEDDFVGVRYTGRFASDPPGLMTVPEFNVVEGTTPIIGVGNSLSRFGDYAHMTVDPEDERTFWYTTEYAGDVDNTDSFTRIVAFQLERQENDLAAVEIVSPVSGVNLTAEEQVTVQIGNFGSQDAAGFTLQLLVDDAAIESAVIEESLASGTTFEHVFSTSVDLSEIREYEITVNVIFEGDQLTANNSLTSLVRNRGGNDLTTNLDLDFEEITCFDAVEGEVIILNNGANAVTNATIMLFVNEALIETIDWTGNLSSGEMETLAVTFTGLSNGNNELSVVTSNPNGTEDDFPQDDRASEDVLVDFGLTEVSVRILTDRFPGEITWQITEQGGTAVLFSGGPFEDRSTEIVESFCLDPQLCYTFTIFDSANDGICCGFGEGNYSLMDEETGRILVVSDGEYTSSESSDFCLNFMCNLEAEIETIDGVGGRLGTILITASGGEGIEYSIDNGVTFQDSGLFEGLDVGGEFQVVVRSDLAFCTIEETVSLNVVVSTDDLEEEVATVVPNPSDGTFKLELSGHQYLDGFLEVQVIDSRGRVIQEKKISRYDDTFEGTISLSNYPDGVYLVRLANARRNRIIKVIKN